MTKKFDFWPTFKKQYTIISIVSHYFYFWFTLFTSIPKFWFPNHLKYDPEGPKLLTVKTSSLKKASFQMFLFMIFTKSYWFKNESQKSDFFGGSKRQKLTVRKISRDKYYFLVRRIDESVNHASSSLCSNCLPIFRQIFRIFLISKNHKKIFCLRNRRELSKIFKIRKKAH